MNTVLWIIFFVAIIFVGQICLAIWSLSLIDNNCQTLSLYSNVRGYLVINVVVATLLFSKFICDISCNEGHTDKTESFELMIAISVVLIGSSSANLALISNINNNIQDCTTVSIDTFKTALNYGGFWANGMILIFGLYVFGSQIYTYNTRSKAKKGKEEKEKQLKEERESLEDQRKRVKEEKARLEVQKELEKLQQEKEKLEEEMKLSQQQLVEDKKQLQADALRKQAGKLTPEERVEKARMMKRDKKIVEARGKIAQLEDQIETKDLSQDSAEEVENLGKKLEEAKEELKKAMKNDKDEEEDDISSFYKRRGGRR